MYYWLKYQRMPIGYKGDRACIVTADKIKAVLGDDGE